MLPRHDGLTSGRGRGEFSRAQRPVGRNVKAIGVVGLPDAASFTPPFTGPLITHNRFTENIVRVGLNYKLGNYYVPSVSKTHRRNPRR
jgi:hypothetical protein